MTGGIFRELFVELSEQAMLAAQAAVEHAVSEAQKPKPFAFASWKPTPREILRTIVRARYGWYDAYSETVVCRPDCDVMEIRYREGCRHMQVIEIPGAVMEAANGIHGQATAVIDHIEAHRHERRCACVKRPDATTTAQAPAQTGD